MIIYKITNLIDNKIYIGKDENNNPKYFGSGLLIKRAIKKYGKKNFKKDILEKCTTPKELNDKEIFWINKLNSISPNGYNLTIGGTGGDTFSIKTQDEKNNIIKKRLKTTLLKHGPNFFKRKLTEECKKNISEANKGKKYPNRKSIILTEEHKKKISEANKGRKCSEEHNKKLSEYKKGTFLSDDIKLKISEKLKGNTNAKGYKHTDETRKIISEKGKNSKSNKGYKWTDEQKLRLKETRKNKNKK